ncbi:MAG: stage 0 sporulation family protein [Chloroflexi bacterium]|nr:stage 0 sporulation family protein [Chloroflexota bacterium]
MNNIEAVVVAPACRRAGRIAFYLPGELKFEAGEYVVVEGTKGPELGVVVKPSVPIGETDSLRTVQRKATPDDLDRYYENRLKASRAYRIALEKIKSHGLPMKLVNVEYTLDGSKIIFYFTAEGRVDFRALVRDLASVFRKRIELHQIGVRDEAKMIGGLGPCGRELCCISNLREFAPVSVKMAKTQSLTLNPAKISGSCGRLMCCLQYEYDDYIEGMKSLPRLGAEVRLPGNEIGRVVDLNVPKQTVIVEFPDSNVRAEHHVNDITILPKEKNHQGGK